TTSSPSMVGGWFLWMMYLFVLTVTSWSADRAGDVPAGGGAAGGTMGDAVVGQLGDDLLIQLGVLVEVRPVSEDLLRQPLVVGGAGVERQVGERLDLTVGEVREHVVAEVGA